MVSVGVGRPREPHNDVQHRAPGTESALTTHSLLGISSVWSSQRACRLWRVSRCSVCYSVMTTQRNRCSSLSMAT